MLTAYTSKMTQATVVVLAILGFVIVFIENQQSHSPWVTYKITTTTIMPICYARQ